MQYVLRKIWFFLAAVIILSAGGDVLYAQNPSSSLYKNRHAHNSTTLSEQQSLRIKDSLMDIYKTSKSLSYKEKVTLLLNITDLSTDDSSMFRAARELYQLASSKGDADNKLEALVILCTEQQPDLEKYMRMAMQLPESHAASELVQYYRYRIEVNDVKNKNKEYRNQIIRSLMKRYSLNRYKDIYTDVMSHTCIKRADRFQKTEIIFLHFYIFISVQYFMQDRGCKKRRWLPICSCCSFIISWKTFTSALDVYMSL